MRCLGGWCALAGLLVLVSCASPASPMSSEVDLGVVSPGPSLDFATAPPFYDFAVSVKPPDLSAPPDLSVSPPDLWTPPRDLAVPVDLSPPPDLSKPPDLSMPPDLSSPPDLRPPVDLAPPGCGDITAAGICDGNTRRYCASNTVVSVACTGGKQCTVDDGQAACRYVEGAPCDGLSRSGLCDANRVIYCHVDGTVRIIDCFGFQCMSIGGSVDCN